MKIIKGLYRGIFRLFKLIFKKIDFGKPALLFAIAGYADFYEGLKCKITKNKIKGIVELIVAAFGILLYVGAFFL